MTVVILCSLSALVGYIIGIPIGRAQAEQEIQKLRKEVETQDDLDEFFRE